MHLVTPTRGKRCLPPCANLLPITKEPANHSLKMKEEFLKYNLVENYLFISLSLSNTTENTANPWATWVGTAQVHLQADVLTVSTTPPIAGGVHWYGTTDEGELRVGRTNSKLHRFLNVQMVSAPNLCSVQGSSAYWKHRNKIKALVFIKVLLLFLHHSFFWMIPLMCFRLLLSEKLPVAIIYNRKTRHNSWKEWAGKTNF